MSMAGTVRDSNRFSSAQSSQVAKAPLYRIQDRRICDDEVDDYIGRPPVYIPSREMSSDFQRFSSIHSLPTSSRLRTDHGPLLHQRHAETFRPDLFHVHSPSTLQGTSRERFSGLGSLPQSFGGYPPERGRAAGLSIRSPWTQRDLDANSNNNASAAVAFQPGAFTWQRSGSDENFNHRCNSPYQSIPWPSNPKAASGSRDLRWSLPNSPSERRTSGPSDGNRTTLSAIDQTCLTLTLRRPSASVAAKAPLPS